jgi:hypothetical protein
MPKLSLIAAVSSLVMLTGCAQLHTELVRDRRDAPWDPVITQGHSLFDQMPNWQQQCGVTVRC